MEKFEDVYERWEQRQLSQAEAAEILGKSERQFRRYIDRYDARGIEGLRDGWLGRASGNAISGRGGRSHSGALPWGVQRLECEAFS